MPVISMIFNYKNRMELKRLDVIIKKRLVALRVLSVLPMLIVLSGYVRLIFTRYWMPPVTSDGLAFCYHSAFPGKLTYVFERYFNFYLNKMITLPFHNLLQGYAFVSLLYHIGIIVLAYLIAQRLAGKVQGLLAAILTALCPFFLIWATENYSDAPCLFFGLAAIYFSLIGKDSFRIHQRFLLCGFFLTASIFSKIYGIIFIIPVLINLWSARLRKNIIYFSLGILAVMLFIASCDYLWLNDFFFHLNPQNYLVYNNFIASKLINLNAPATGTILFYYLEQPDLIFYFIIFIVFIIQGLRFLENRENFDWKKRGSFSLALAGVILGIIFTKNDLSYPGWSVLPNYNYCIFIPWIIAFCSVLGFIKENEFEKTKFSKSDIISGFLSILFIFAIFTTGDTLYSNFLRPSFGRFFYVAFWWVHIFAIALILVAGNYLRKNGYRKITTFLLLIGCFVIIWHNAFWAHGVPSYKRKLNTETIAFLEKYRELSKSASIIPSDCDVARGFEIKATLLLSRLADEEDLVFYSRKDFGVILKSKPVPFYVLTKSENELLKKEADAIGLRVIDNQDDAYFGCSFFKIVSVELEDKKAQ